jgi:hypothetical protein
MDEATDPHQTPSSAEREAQRDAISRRLDAMAAKAARPAEIDARLAKLESSVIRLGQTVGKLTEIVTRLADERLGGHEPDGSPPSPVLPEPDDSSDNATDTR